MRLLIVEDDEKLAVIVSDRLTKSGFAVDQVTFAADATDALSTVQYDAAVLDIGLPDASGIDVLSSLRRKGNTMPVLVISARQEVDDRVDALNLGADDYLTKPFDSKELVARVRALVRRPATFVGQQLEAGRVRMDTATREVTVGDVSIIMTRRELDMLEHLLRRNGRVVSKTFLEERLYGFENGVASNSVEVIVHRLRKRLQKAKAGVEIHTVRGVGYFLLD